MTINSITQLWAYWSARAVGETKEMFLSKFTASADKEIDVVWASTLYEGESNGNFKSSITI
jgi:hypothetical protein